MRSRRCAWLLLLLSACGNPDVTAAVTAPVAAPLVARERLLHDLGNQRAAARQRAAGMSAVLDAAEPGPSDR
jgi:hypothetical protein